jgi:HSP20 family protein
MAVARPLTVAVRAYKADAAPEKDAPADNQVQHQKESAQVPTAAAPRSLHPAVRLPSLFNEMQREMDAMTRMFGLPSLLDEDPFFARPAAMLSKMELPSLPTMRVAVDVEEDDKAYTIKADTPGIPKDALKIKVMDGTLTISGERSEEKREEGETGKEGGKAPLRYERSYGSFTRSFGLPANVDVEGIRAEAQDGVLTVTIPKVPEQEPKAKEIEIK